MKSDAIIGAVEGVTKKWAKQRKKEERAASALMNRRYAMTRCYHTSIKDAAWQVMEKAYLKASANGTLPAHARQIMYAARPHIQQIADKEIGKGFDQYYTQTWLPDYIEEEGVDWNFVFDARGNFHEPHTEEQVPLGTIQVRNYLGRVQRHFVGEPDFNVWEKRYPTLGPENRYGAILFIEKEGFMPLFEEVKLAERYDLAIMSTKGMSVTASRELVDVLCGNHDIPLLALHDFDKAGFSIIGTLKRDTRRYTFTNCIEVIDLGLRLDDIGGLITEGVYTRSPEKARWNLEENGATGEEIEFLLRQRVELNAFASDELVKWIESKLEQHGVTKVIPDTDSLAGAYHRTRAQARMQAKIDEIIEAESEEGEVGKVPDDLRKQVEERLKSHPATSWDEAVREIVEADEADEE